MAATIDIPAAGYRYVPYAFQYPAAWRRWMVIRSSGWSSPARCRSPPASPGSRITCAGWACHLSASAPANCGRPEQFTDAGFIAFNRQYIGSH